MKRAMSYLWPLTKKVRSKYSGNLEITWMNGRKVLDSPNANYSYGALQEVLERGLAEINAERAAPVLLLGLGGGNAINLLRKKYRYYGKITAVEIDPVVIEIAEDEFDLRQHEPLEIICADALEYVKHAQDKFGLIIIDLFLDLEVPLQFFSAEFIEEVSALLLDHGKILFNAGINAAHDVEIDGLLKSDNLDINFRKREEVYGSNTLLLGEKLI